MGQPCRGWSGRFMSQSCIAVELRQVGLEDRLDQALTRYRRTGEQVALLMLDLDRFKQVNDTLGHNAGDKLVQEVGERLKSLVRETDTVARIGGDEFVVIVERPDWTDAAVHRELLRRLETISGVDLVDRSRSQLSLEAAGRSALVRPADIPYLVGNSDKLFSRTGWRPSRSLRPGSCETRVSIPVPPSRWSGSPITRSPLGRSRLGGVSRGAISSG